MATFAIYLYTAFFAVKHACWYQSSSSLQLMYYFCDLSVYLFGKVLMLTSVSYTVPALILSRCQVPQKTFTVTMLGDVSLRCITRKIKWGVTRLSVNVGVDGRSLSESSVCYSRECGVIDRRHAVSWSAKSKPSQIVDSHARDGGQRVVTARRTRSSGHTVAATGSMPVVASVATIRIWISRVTAHGSHLSTAAWQWDVDG